MWRRPCQKTGDQTTPEDFAYSHRGVILLVVLVGQFMAVLDNNIVAIALPTITRVFHVPLGQSQWIATAYIITIIATVLIFGTLSSALGKSRLFIAGLLLFVASSFACGLARLPPPAGRRTGRPGDRGGDAPFHQHGDHHAGLPAPRTGKGAGVSHGDNWPWPHHRAGSGRYPRRHLRLAVHLLCQCPDRPPPACPGYPLPQAGRYWGCHLPARLARHRAPHRADGRCGPDLK